jgi:hypothetical protein
LPEEIHEKKSMTKRLTAFSLTTVACLLAASSSLAQVPTEHPQSLDQLQAYAPLDDVPGTVSWRLLDRVQFKTIKKKVTPVFDPAILVLDGQTVKLRGYLLPVDTGTRVRHFLLSALPPSCPFCIPGGATALVEVKARTGFRFVTDPVVAEGRLNVIRTPEYGLLYQLQDAVPSSLP